MKVMTKTSEDCMLYFRVISKLIKENWKESGVPIEMNIDDTKKTYKALADAGVLFLVMIYDGDAPVGYCAVVTTPHMLNHSVSFVNASGLYVLPEYRKGRAAALIMREIRQFAKHHGAHHIMWHAPAGSEFEKALGLRHRETSSLFMEAIL